MNHRTTKFATLASLTLYISATLFITTQPTLVQAQATSSVQSTEQSHRTILLLGIDSRDEGSIDQGRSDTIMVLDINKEDNSALLASIPRDSYVKIEGRGMDKINHAYAFGGADLSVTTVNDFLGTTIRDYVIVNMAGLKEIVEAVGTISVTPPTTFSIGGYTFTEGVAIDLTPDMALAYARERYTSGGDYGRQARQREIVEAIVAKAASADSIMELASMYQAVSTNIKTNLGLADLMGLFNTYKSLSSIDNYQLEGYGTQIDGIYYEQIDEDSLAGLQENLRY